MDVRLYCFAHAGAGVSSFDRWPERSGRGVEIVPVLLPGREARRREPRPTGRDALLADLFGPLAAAAAADGPYALYGHSLGGLVAYTLAHALLEAGLPAPEFLAVGACPAPDTAPLRDTDGLSDAELLSFVGDMGAAPTGLLAEEGSVWHRVVLPVLRDDVVLADALRAAATDPATGGPLPVPVLAVDGRRDPAVAAAAVDAWRGWTTERCVRRTVPGDHFFVRDRETAELLGRACRVARRRPV
jgi:surfactin synthase thioesterase subunit